MVGCDLGIGWHLVMTLTTQEHALNTLLLHVLLVCAAGLAVVGEVCLRLQRQRELLVAKPLNWIWLLEACKLATPLLEYTYDDTGRAHTSQKDQAHEQPTGPKVLE